MILEQLDRLSQTGDIITNKHVTAYKIHIQFLVNMHNMLQTPVAVLIPRVAGTLPNKEIHS